MAQERLFSPRILHFGSNQLWWECTARAACEMSPGGDPDFSAGPQLRPWKHLADCFSASEPTPISEMTKLQRYRRWRAWWDFVEAYTTSDFTFTSDKLIAVSAVVKAMIRQHAAGNEEYLAGLWRWWLELDLYWLVFYDKDIPSSKKTFRPNPDDTWRAPSWSWASVDGPVWRTSIGPNGDATSLIRILSTEIAPLHGSGRTGLLKAASLTIECRSFYADWVLSPLSDSSRDGDRIESANGNRIITGSLNFDDFNLASATTDSGRTRVACMPGAYIFDSSGDLTRKDFVHGLVLESVPNTVHQFRRTGQFLANTGVDGLYKFVGEERLEDTGVTKIVLL